MPKKRQTSKHVKQLAAFRDAVQSLKLYRRAEIPGSDDDASLIEKLYVDPLPEEQIFRTILKPNTSFLIGRKGTGKSTIFQRLQYELLKDKTKTSAYIDIKTVFESCQVEPQLLEQIHQSATTLPSAALEKLLLYKAFLQEVINEIKNELHKRAQMSLWERVKAAFGGQLDELFEDLDGILAEANTDRFVSVLGIRTLRQNPWKSFVSACQTKRYGYYCLCL